MHIRWWGFGIYSLALATGACNGAGKAPAASAAPPPGGGPGDSATTSSRTVASSSSGSGPGHSEPQAAGRSDAVGRSDSSPAHLVSRSIPLPGASGPAGLDYIGYSQAGSKVWVPTAATGSLDVLDTSRDAFVRVDGFASGARTTGGRTRVAGPSAVAVGVDFVFVGDRFSSEVCPVAIATLEARRCTKLPVGIDGVAFVGRSREVWVTAPQAHALEVLDAADPGALKLKASIEVSGSPEGFAVDEARGRFFTNLEDRGDTVVIDVAGHRVAATWNAGCGADGPRGLAYAADRGLLIVACTDHVQVLDAGHDGARLGRLETGAGVDNIDYGGGSVYVAAARAATLTVARLDAHGALQVIASGETSEGARNPVVDGRGRVYVADSPGARLLVFDGPPPRPSGFAQ